MRGEGEEEEGVEVRTSMGSGLVVKEGVAVVVTSGEG